MKLEIEVENIKCGGCLNSINKSIQEINSDYQVSVKGNDCLIIESNHDINKEAIVNKLHQLGYPVKGENNVLLQAKSYVSCAVGKITS